MPPDVPKLTKEQRARVIEKAQDVYVLLVWTLMVAYRASMEPEEVQGLVPAIRDTLSYISAGPAAGADAHADS